MSKGRYFMGRTMATVGVKGVARLGLVAALLAVGLLVAAPSAEAIVYNLTSNHCTVQADCGAPGTIFGTVTLTQSGLSDGTGTVNVTVHLNSPYAFANTSAVDGQAFKFNATGVVVGDISIDAHTPPLQANAGAFNGDGTGTFGFGISCPSCGGGLSSGFTTDIVFHVANATIADLTAANALGNVFVADVGNTTNGATGPIDATTPTPEPASTALLGLSLFGIGLVAALRRKKA